MTTGTSNFVCTASAESYYASYGYTPKDVANKVKSGEISIGRPATKPGEHITLLDNGKRYGIRTI